MHTTSNREFPNPLPDGFTNNVRLVTGATGFLGKRLLQALAPSETRPVICLVRANDAADARRRGAEVSANPNVLWLRGDISETQLGLNSATWHALAGATQEIYHSAASVEFTLPLDKAHEINVVGTTRLLSLAQDAQQQGGFRRFHHISTAYASGLTSRLVDASYLPEDHARNFRNTYERTKARAERILRAQTRINVSIYRPSIIAGDTKSGATDNWNVLYAPMKQIHRGRMPLIPKGGAALLDCVGVDYVADGIAHFAATPQIGHQYFHLTTGTGCFTVSELINACLESCKRYDPGFRGSCKVVSQMQWQRLKLSVGAATLIPTGIADVADIVRRRAITARNGLDNFAPYEPYTSVSSCFDNREERAELEAVGITMPHWPLYLTRIIRYALQAKFGSRNLDAISTQQIEHQDANQAVRSKLNMAVG